MPEDKGTALIDWFWSHGGRVHASISLQIDEEFGYHFRARTDIPASTEENGTLVCRCPSQLTLSYLNVLTSCPSNVKACATESVVSKVVGKVESHVVGCFFLCEQRLKGKESFWWPYIDLLPKEKIFTTPLWFDDDDLMWLLGTTMHTSQELGKSAVLERRDMWQTQYASGIMHLKEASVDASPFSWCVLLREGWKLHFDEGKLIIEGNCTFGLRRSSHPEHSRLRS